MHITLRRLLAAAGAAALSSTVLGTGPAAAETQQALESEPGMDEDFAVPFEAAKEGQYFNEGRIVQSGSFDVGRDAAEVRLTDPQVSRRHLCAIGCPCAGRGASPD